MRFIFLCFMISGCANMPTQYGDLVKIKAGLYTGYYGRLIGDCSGFENYMVLLDTNKKICIRSWNIEKI